MQKSINIIINLYTTKIKIGDEEFDRTILSSNYPVIVHSFLLTA